MQEVAALSGDIVLSNLLASTVTLRQQNLFDPGENTVEPAVELIRSDFDRRVVVLLRRFEVKKPLALHALRQHRGKQDLDICLAREIHQSLRRVFGRNIEGVGLLISVGMNSDKNNRPRTTAITEPER